MAYDTKLEERVDNLSAGWNLTKKKMFGGVGYLLNGNMVFGINKDEVIIRTDEEQGQELLKKSGIRIFDITGRPMRNWFMAGGDAIKSDKDLEKLLETGRDYSLNLPPK